ncbi:MAG: xanthine dehydrogenase [Chloroflexota bacterium]|nr:MAG: xanthine dehydrogenase [Chloroflexota bacterium]
MTDLFDSLLEASKTTARLATASIIGPDGLPQGKLGLRLFVRQDGSATGSIQGDRVQDEVVQACRAALKSGRPATLTVKIGANEAQDLGLAPGTGLEVFVDVIQSHDTLFVVGAGHIGHALARMAKVVGFEVAVVDDRKDFANRDRFPDADQVITADIGETVRSFPITPATYVVIVTRGHRYDESALAGVIDSPAAYIGMIGSRRRVKSVLQRLAEEGASAEAVDRIHAPIGLDIGAETPEEIAVSILAEIIQTRHGRQSSPNMKEVR